MPEIAGENASANMNSPNPGANQGVNQPGTIGNPIIIKNDPAMNVQNADGNNSNDADSNNSEDNNGQPSALEALFVEKQEKPQDSKPNDKGNEAEGNPANPMEALKKTLDNLQFSPVLTEEIQQQLAKEDLKGFNESMNKMGQEAVNQALSLSAQMLSQIIPQMQEQFTAQINEALGAQKGFSALEIAIPEVKNPALAPVIKPIYEQALLVNKGDHEAAIDATKRALGELNVLTAGHADVGTVPTNEGSQPLQDHLAFLTRPTP